MPDPCLDYSLCPSFFSLFGMFADAVSLFFSFFLSDAGETQALVVWVSPCVSWTRSLTSPRTSRTTSTPRSPPRLCFFFSDDVVRLSGGGRSRSVLGVLGRSLSLSLFRFWRSWWLYECMHRLGREGAAYLTAPPFMMTIIVSFWG